MAVGRTIVEILLQAKDATGRAFGAVSGRLRSIKDSIFSLRTAVAGFVAFVTTRVVGQIVKAFADQEAAVIRLNTALRVTGRYTEDGTKKIQAMATEMQRLTTVSDEAALGISATLAQLATGLTTDLIADAQKAVIGLASAFGLDLQSAATLVGKTLSGEMNALGRYGIRIDETANQQEKFNQIMRQAAPFFEVAVGATQSLTGQYAQAKNAIGELLETFGQIIAETFQLTTAQGSLRDRINELNEKVKAHIGEWVRWGNIAVAVVRAIVVSFANLVKFFFNVGQVIGDVFLVIYHAGKQNFINLYNEIVRIIDDIIVAINALSPFDDIPLLKPVDPGPAIRAMNEAKAALVSDANDIADAAMNILETWKQVVVELQKPVKASVTFDISTRGGGKNTPVDKRQITEQAAIDRTKEAERVLQRASLGGMSTAELNAEILRLLPAMAELRASGDLTNGTWVALAQAMEKLNEKAHETGLVFESFEGISFGGAFQEQVQDMLNSLGTLNEALAKTTVDGMGAFMQASVEAFGAIAEGSKQSARDFESAMLGALATVASMFAQMFAARATAALAEAILPSSVLSGTSAGGLAAAGYFTAAALAMSALSGALRGAAKRTAGGAGGGGGAAGAAARTDDVAREGKEADLNVIGGLLDTSDPRQADALARAITHLISLGVTRVNVRQK